MLIPLVPFGVILTILYQRLHAKGDEKRRLRENGSAAVTPAKDFLARLGPLSIMWGTDEENHAHLSETHEKWWEEVRPPLLVYANAHPSEAIREFATVVVEAIQQDMSATRYLLMTRNTADSMEAYESSERAHTEAQRLVEELLQRIRDY